MCEWLSSELRERCAGPVEHTASGCILLRIGSGGLHFYLR